MATPDKLKITAYNSAGGKETLSTNPDDSYSALVNPETYTIQYQVNLNAKKVPGNAGSDPSYIDTSPPTLQFDFLFDAGNRCNTKTKYIGCDWRYTRCWRYCKRRFQHHIPAGTIRCDEGNNKIQQRYFYIQRRSA